MRKTPWLAAERYRIQPAGYETKYGDSYGAFFVPYEGAELRCLACSGEESRRDQGKEHAWDHVSVSLANRCPTWEEMSYIKNLFFTPAEEVFQFHPRAGQYINLHPYTLHLWRPLNKKIPLPPINMV